MSQCYSSVRPVRKVMPFWDHVYELRNRIVLVITCSALFSVVSYVFYPDAVVLIQSILREELYVTSITEGFLTRLKTSLLFGIYCSIPLLGIQISLFAAPALSGSERFYLVAVLVSSFILMSAGLLFALKAVLPISLRFLRSEVFYPGDVSRLLSYTLYLQFFFQFIIGFGLFFQFPIVIIMLLKFRIIDTSFLLRNFKYFIGIIFLVSAAVTPPDIVSQILLALPMTLLYGVCIVLGKVFRMDD
ncbi:twin arginine-targeting protein translocase TatC [Marispirochaeta aestuarii]|uniref:Sec-independent protein translocase protein TatC n=1 Tax=Marispirochaeta aestuarii TaxID=1963862 RepID=A0A1Y1RUY0_9SPIO|nr:twin arginine-targeting protein translocase TatC [Marispirochaeta aestuarii]